MLKPSPQATIGMQMTGKQLGIIGMGDIGGDLAPALIIKADTVNPTPGVILCLPCGLLVSTAAS